MGLVVEVRGMAKRRDVRRPAPGRKLGRPKASRPRRRKPARKLVEIEPDILDALTWLARDRMQDFSELAHEAFRDVLKKHRRPVTLKEQLVASARTPANDEK